MARLTPPPIQSPMQESPNQKVTRVWSRWFRDISRSVESTSTRGVIDVGGGETHNLSEAGVIVNLIANTDDATVILPKATADNVGEEVTVTLTNDTFNGIIQPKTGDTVIGETSIEMNLADTTYDCVVLSAGQWVFI